MKINREKLLESALALFMSVNYEKASFAELGKMLNMSKAGLLKYYPNRQELFKAVVDKHVFGIQISQNQFTAINITLIKVCSTHATNNAICGWLNGYTKGKNAKH